MTDETDLSDLTKLDDSTTEQNLRALDAVMPPIEKLSDPEFIAARQRVRDEVVKSPEPGRALLDTFERIEREYARRSGLSMASAHEAPWVKS